MSAIDSVRSRFAPANTAYGLEAQASQLDALVHRRMRHGVAWIGVAALTAYLLDLIDDRMLVPDTYLGLVSGRYIAHHWVPHTDTLTIAGGRWIDQQWLADLVYWGSFRIGSYALVLIVSGILVGAGYGLLAAFMTSLGVEPQRAALCALLGLVAGSGWGEVRAQSFAYVLYVGLLWIGYVDEHRRRFSIRFPGAVLPLLVVWGNLHGSAALAAALVFVYAIVRSVLDEIARDRGSAIGYLVTALAAPLALLVTPYGLSTVGYYRDVLGNGALVRRVVSEWSKPTIADPFAWASIALLVIAAVSVVHARRRRRRTSAVLVGAALVTAVLSTQAQRYEIWLVLSAIPLAAASFAGPGSNRPAASPRQLRALIATAMVSITVAAAAVTVSVTSSKHVKFEGFVPVPAVTAAEAVLACDPAATVLADHYGADSLLWLDPSSVKHVAYDGRLEIYGTVGLTRFVDFVAGQNVAEIANAGRYDVLVASRHDAHLVHAIRHLPGWVVVSRAGSGVAAVRADSSAARCASNAQSGHAFRSRRG